MRIRAELFFYFSFAQHYLLLNIKTVRIKATINRTKPATKSSIEIKTLSNGNAFTKLRMPNPNNKTTRTVTNILFFFDRVKPPPDINNEFKE